MKPTLAERQARMRQRMEQPAKPPVQKAPPAVSNPVDYSKPVEYLAEDIQPLHYWPKACGVYLLCEGERFYIGQSVDVPARYASHRLQPIACKFEDPRCVVLAKIHEGESWSRNTHALLNAEARFISAALQIGLPLTNSLTEYKKEQLASRFSDVSAERVRLEKAIKLLC
jgi:hypothetical protein